MKMFNELLKNVMNLGIITVDDVKRLTSIELMMLIIERTNGLLNHVENIDEKLAVLLENIKTDTNEVLQKWTEDGTFDTLLNQSALKMVNDRIDETNAQLSKKADNTALAIERARIDSLTRLSEGSTTGDAELIDARIGADGITYPTLGDSIRKQISNNITPYIMLPYDKVIDTYIMYNTGSAITHSNPGVLFSSDYVELLEGRKLYLKNLNYNYKDNSGLAFYDENKNFISGYQYDHETNLEIDVPSNASFVRFTGNNTSTEPLIVYQNQYESSINFKKEVNQSINNVLDEISMKHVYETTFTDNYYIDYRSGQAFAHNFGAFSITDYIRLKDGYDTLKTQNLNFKFNDNSGLAFYDKNKNYISGYQYNKDVDLSIAVPVNARYVRLTVLTTSKATIQIYTDIDLISFIAEAKNIMNSNNYDYCQIFHKIAGIGDSLMSGELAFWDEETSQTKYVDCYKYSWLSNLCKTIGAEPVHYSRGGHTTKSWLAESLASMKNETVKPSAYFIALGTNDAPNITLGTIDDCGTTNETFYGMYSKIITEIKTFNPKAKIFCCSLYYNYPANTEAFCTAIREMAEKYGCYHVDFLNRYGLYYSQSNPFISAGHFTCQGYVRVADEMKTLVNEIIEDHLSDFNFLGNDYKEI